MKWSHPINEHNLFKASIALVRKPAALSATLELVRNWAANFDCNATNEDRGGRRDDGYTEAFLTFGLPMTPPAAPQTFADHLAILGNIPPERVHSHPAPGTATADHWESAVDGGAVCELVNGVLVDKAMGWYESLLASCLNRHIGNCSAGQRLGVVAGEQGFITLPGGQIRAPDVAFYLRRKFVGGQLPGGKRPSVVPDIAVEVLSEGNTVAEIAQKRRELFTAGTSILWVFDPRTRSVAVYMSPTVYTMVDVSGELTGGDILPNLRIPLAEVFAEIDGE